MAVKALCSIYDTAVEDGELVVYLNVISVASGVKHPNVNAGSFAAGSLGAVINLALTNFAKQYAIDNLEVTFGLGDSAKLIQGIDLV